MPIAIDVLRVMVASGATAEMIVNAVEAQQLTDERQRAAKRIKDAARQRRKRASEKSQRQRVTPRDTADATEAIVETATTAPQAVVGDGVAENGAEFQQKEIPPTPPKEKLQSYLPFSEDSGSESRGSEDTRARRNGRAMRLPDDWVPTLDDLVFARTILPKNHVAIEVDTFRDHWHSANGPPAVKRNWSAAWRNWCRKAVKINGSNGGRNGTHRGRGGPLEVLADLKRAAAAQRGRPDHIDQ